MSALKVALLLFVFSPLSACGESLPASVEITREKQPSLQSTLSVGQHLILLTAPAPVTAYHWEARIPAESVVALASPPRYVGGGGIPGGLQRTRFELLAKEAGRVEINFYLLPGADTSASSAVDRFVLQLGVR